MADLINSVNEWGSTLMAVVFIGVLMAALLLDVT